jgi:hypothetical protein
VYAKYAFFLAGNLQALTTSLDSWPHGPLASGR